jgi:N-acetylmuramoyl-L-alanine amidase
MELEQRLAGLRYFVGAIDGLYDADTELGVMAYQKVKGMARTGQATPDVIADLIATTTTPPALVPGGGANRVEVDLTRQVLFLYEGDALSSILAVSTGTGGEWPTNKGSFSIYRQGRGWETGPLGRLYNPQYFDGGIAVHGSNSVPAEPASHGCVRISVSAAEWFPSHVGIGTPVYVLGA